jgi:hypothetical protein
MLARRAREYSGFGLVVACPPVSRSRLSRALPRSLCSLLAFGSLVLTGAPAAAQAPSADSGAKPAPTSDDDNKPLPAYHHSIFSWEHGVSTQTLGVGDTPQSYNPTYTMGFVAKTRYYLVDDTPKGEHFSLRLDGGLYREFTNSDVTTERGEWTFSDTGLAAVYVRRIQGPRDRDGTSLELRPLTLSLPTSKISYDSGRYFQAGAVVGIGHATPLFRGKLDHVSATTRLAVGYARWFARATVPTNESLERVRLGPDGHTLPSDALTGSTLVRDQIEIAGRVRLELGQNLFWTTDAAFAPAWKYAVQRDVMLCGVVLTGCTDVKLTDDDRRYLVRTSFSTEFSLRVAKGVSVEVGYGNANNQLGQDGRRRSFFYSPDSVFYASLSFMPHELAESSRPLAKNLFAPFTL